MGICRQRGQSAWSTARRRNDYVEFTVMQHLVEEPTGIERGKCDQGCAALTYERKYSAYSILAWQRIGKLGIKSAAAAAAAARHRVAALGIAFISSLPCQQCQTNRTGASRSFGGQCASLDCYFQTFCRGASVEKGEMTAVRTAFICTPFPVLP